MTAAESAPGTLVARMGIEIVEEDPGGSSPGCP